MSIAIETPIHPKTEQSLASIVTNPYACYLFSGEQGSGRQALALELACRLHCGAKPACTTCKRIRHGNHEDTVVIQPNEKGTITVEMAGALRDSLSRRKSDVSGKRVVIINSAEAMTTHAQNALLKVIEEPPPGTIFVLIVTSRNGLLATIRSRCQTVFVRLIGADQAKDYVKAAGVAPANQENLVALAAGRAGLLSRFVDEPELIEQESALRTQALELLNTNSFTRLLQVDTIVGNKHLSELMYWIGHEMRKHSRDNQNQMNLEPLQRYFANKQAGVSTKNALTDLMVHL